MTDGRKKIGGTVGGKFSSMMIFQVIKHEVLEGDQRSKNQKSTDIKKPHYNNV